MATSSGPAWMMAVFLASMGMEPLTPAPLAWWHWAQLAA